MKVKEIFLNKVSRFRLITVMDMLIKSLFFIVLLEVKSVDKLEFNNMIFKFTFILLVYLGGYLFSENRQRIYYISLNVLYSLLLIFDLWYFRVNADLVELKNIFYLGTFSPSGKSLYQFRNIDLLFILDIIVIIAYVIIKKVKNNEERSFKKSEVTIISTSIILVISFICMNVLSFSEWENSMFAKRVPILISARPAGLVGYNLTESITTLGMAINTEVDYEKSEIEKWLAYNKENLKSNEYSGIAEGKNIIFIHVESLENFIINKSVNGKEVSPFLNKLANEGMYFTNIYEQNNAGNSIDCDFMVNTSIYPLGDEITAVNYGQNVYSNSLPRILESEGYKTISTHAEEEESFNWGELHRTGFGVQKLWNINDYIYEETVGYGLADRSLFDQISEKLEQVQEPFFLQLVTLANHGPFDIDKKYRELDLPKEIDESYLGGYFESVHYTDKQIEMFFDKLEKNGLLDNTMFVIYGDHSGVHKYYNDEIQNLSYEGDWWKEYDHKIPLIIYSKGIEPKIIEASGGQVDIPTTVLYLLNVDKDKYSNTSMGRVLVNTNRDATIIKGNEIKGNVKDNKELEHLLKAYEIGEMIIKNNYFSNN